MGQPAGESRLQRKTEKNPHCYWESRGTLTAHVIVKYRLMGIVKPELLNAELLMNALQRRISVSSCGKVSGVVPFFYLHRENPTALGADETLSELHGVN